MRDGVLGAMLLSSHSWNTIVTPNAPRSLRSPQPSHRLLTCFRRGRMETAGAMLSCASGCHAVSQGRLNSSTPAHPQRHVYSNRIQDARFTAVMSRLTHQEGFVGSELHSKLSRVLRYPDHAAGATVQGSPEWLHARSRRLTASTVAKAAGLLPLYVLFSQSSSAVIMKDSAVLSA